MMVIQQYHLGYAGLYECVKYMTGHSHTDNGEGKEFAIKVMQKLNDKCKEWKEAEKYRLQCLWNSN